MKLKPHHCTEFCLRLRTERENFAHERFFKDPRVFDEAAAWETGEPLNLTSFTHSPRSHDYHIHAYLRLAKAGVELRIRWVTGVLTGPKGTQPPFAEGFLPWIARFFKKNVGPITALAYYSFPTSRYRSAISLPMPFVVTGRGRGPKTILGMTFSAEFKGASRATIETEIMPDDSIWGMIYAPYKNGFRSLAPERLLPEFGRAIGEYVIKR
ncbi:MAG: hypothetical protein LAN84_15120 [Acidobacteriia bacterium]|nr:hypothetical protein [Terriglobia bacterium]